MIIILIYKVTYYLTETTTSVLVTFQYIYILTNFSFTLMEDDFKDPTSLVALTWVSVFIIAARSLTLTFHQCCATKIKCFIFGRSGLICCDFFYKIAKKKEGWRLFLIVLQF